uniref:Uncharacterized protein n=1 Tax=Leptocylindrus danicus TaxID=163516 RepID=A0A7S2KMD5_9STRA|mmetsp:Transcript_24358/g.36467  ORF Transcript_24358/g.36467 Transcript_24358/m.36467 type:complete len:198 (+) Transcript_24358:192-785(+)|eukprot:CAMPEP_0116026204 /NCGR_PEP_ID=MMETSP0321-20121206/13663_1 /TAXON_ID=163516 /ORGANISM="Leptocylindrus danicus var. danicus, Strain B650" /LENGTH=197 /DNA_ID=CAMNT_0003498861 /DNA_START=75 /DNA_END=668 /DNA_ORIENTATION=+
MMQSISLSNSMMVVEDDYVFVEVEDDDISFIEMEEVDGVDIFRPQSVLSTTNDFAKSSNQTLLSMAESSSVLVSDDEDTIMTDDLKVSVFDECGGNVNIMEIDEESVVTNPVAESSSSKPPKSSSSIAGSSTSTRRLSKKKLRREARRQKKEEKKKKREEREKKAKEKQADAAILLVDQTEVRLEKLGKVERRLGRM